MKVAITWLENHLSSDSFLRSKELKITLFAFCFLGIVNSVYAFSSQNLKGCEITHEKSVTVQGNIYQWPGGGLPGKPLLQWYNNAINNSVTVCNTGK